MNSCRQSAICTLFLVEKLELLKLFGRISPALGTIDALSFKQ